MPWLKKKIFQSSNHFSNISPPNYPSNGNFRVDNTKCLYKVAISKFATEEINNLIENSELPKRLKKKIHVPNSKLFTSNVKELDNLNFLSYDMKTVFTYGKTDDNYQGSNERNISNILEYPGKAKEIIEFLSMTYKEIIELFYKSKKFEEFKAKDEIKFITERLEKEKNISLFEQDGLINLFKMTQKKRKGEEFCNN